MRQRKKLFPFLVLSILSFLGILYVFFFLPPDFIFFTVNHELSTVWLFFLLLFIFFLSLTFYLLVSLKRATFVGLFVVVFLWLRLIHLTHFLYPILLLLLFILLDLSFQKRK
ncbi:MAG: hypothetical protein A3F31_01245 [Candidatus Levybacteria bacterium RIFCSPHIGHO2_12_FULL_38_12]|nr:MAG: hypothetical protein A2770_01690 [Candidatus Levybacteria bacterium RIFCSPHIGHO2_01_FULL_38_12]OGH22009.1 MAG: hypothetical protein A3D75_03220 [Candidatus Levybacteria bacterium RIFCSPHIGHO2_02_FULL_37_18]OGH23272.1 MAG: hypothetical protein A3F31_01245 [Candidatus Levybacteria bacterium RIFCSPHIGHO2_12_FULL_38_12]OGH33702.1 MAG: hypothetical protein A3A47_02655 [Candidatus Levybacteria bacterium RIFCSPLOWO2_01_FULL_37_20]OGH44608.1 MAG: hypothetical protein A3J14_00740 [Candidatus Lev